MGRLSEGMTENSEFESLSEPASITEAGQMSQTVSQPTGVQPSMTAPAPGGGGLGGGNEMAGLVLLINTVLGGLGTLYGVTGSAGITLAAALLVLLIIVVVVVVRRMIAPGDGVKGEDGRGGK